MKVVRRLRQTEQVTAIRSKGDGLRDVRAHSNDQNRPLTPP